MLTREPIGAIITLLRNGSAGFFAGNGHSLHYRPLSLLTVVSLDSRFALRNCRLSGQAPIQLVV